MIHIEGLIARAGAFEILKGIDLDIGAGEFVALLGPNGAGKTTLIKHFNGLRVPSAGSVTVDGMDTRRVKTSRLARSVGFLFQNPDHQIISNRIDDEIAFGLKQTGIPEPERGERVREAAAILGLEGLLDADIAFQNGGGVRASIKSGAITVGDIIAALPFDNKLMKVEVDGKTVWEALENGVKPYPSAAGQFLQVSGLCYAFDPSKPAGSRIVDVTMDDGSKLDFGRKYTVVINDFMAGGGDGYSMLKCTGVGANDPDVALLLSTNYYLRDVFREHVAAKGAIAPKTTGRITIVGK